MAHPENQLRPSVRVLLWTAPRCMSSASERSIRELETVKVVYEPHLKAYFYGPERRSDMWNTGDTNPGLSATFKAADDRLLQPYDKYQAVFVKSMAFCVRESYEKYTTGRFTNFKHTFLIRNPRKAFLSVMKACEISNFSLSQAEYGVKEL